MASERLKRVRYESLAKDLTFCGYEVMVYTVEVGSRGYVALSTDQFLRYIGVSTPDRKKVIRKLAEAALRSSYVIYLSRNCKEWGNQ